jgi:alginate O-acetyltransferase complex protein AlgI
MVFSSIPFLFYFLPLVLIFYYFPGSNSNTRNIVLLVASLIFYAQGEGIFTLVMCVSILANFVFGLWVHRAHEHNQAKLQVGLAIAFNVLLLVFFKYTNFLVDNVNKIVLMHLHLKQIDVGRVHLPIGVSFFTFHCISYLMDIYRRQTPPNRSLRSMALYVALFPQLVAGPIIRYKDIAGQLASRVVSTRRFSDGANRFLIGLGKKVLVANVLSQPADKIFGIPLDQMTTPLAWLGAVFYTLQIYFDFSGYSDMAIGLGQMFGFKFMENFNYPYISSSIRGFWRRWHISLSTWFRDYLYIPLGGNRCSPARVTCNLVLVFFLCGLWHGASWTFIVWGLYHGAFLGLERGLFGRLIDRLWKPLAHAYALVVVTAGWVFFRAASLDQATAFLKSMAGFSSASAGQWHPGMVLNAKVNLVLAVAVCACLPIIPRLRAWRNRKLAAHEGQLLLGTGLNVLVDYAVTPTILMLSCMSLASGHNNPFIYYQF